MSGSDKQLLLAALTQQDLDPGKSITRRQL